MKIKFKIIPDVTYNNLKSAVCTDELRFVLTGASIDLVNQYLVITDSHVLVAYPIEILESDSDIDHKIVPINLFNRLRYMGEFHRSVLKALDVEYVLLDDFAEAVFKDELLYRVRYIDGKYPNWKNIIPQSEDKKPLSEIGINPTILSKFLKALPNSNPFEYKITLFDANKAMLFEQTNIEVERKIIGVVMPVKLPSE